ncbi:MAG: ABC transporter ATP-binding protein [Chitinophagaceae bacterium]
MPRKQTTLSRISNLLRLEKNEISAIYVYAIFNGLIQLSLPIGIQAIIGYVIGASMRASLAVLIILVVLGVFFTGLMQMNQMKIIEKIQQKLFVRYSFAFANQIPRFDLKKTDNVFLPELINRFFDVPNLQKSLSKILLEIPTATIQVFFGLTLLSFYHPAFILFGIILVLLLWAILKYSGRRGLETSIEESSYKYKVAGWLEEAARVIRSVKLARHNDLHLRKTDEQVTRYLNARTSHFRILLFQYRVMVFFKTAITAAMLIVGTFLLVNQQLNVGQFIAAEIVILLVINAVEKLIVSLSSVYDTLTAIEKLAEVTETPAETEGTVEMTGNNNGMKVEMRQLFFGYNEDNPVLKNISLLVNPGEKICITGKNSAGKTTLLKLLTGSYSDFKGAVLLDDVPVGNYNLSSLRSQTAVIISQQDIFHGSLWENITLDNKSLTIEQVTALANKTGLSEFVATLKEGYDTILDPTGRRLSRSVTKKILLVRALAANPRLLLVENLWEGLEERQRKEISDLLRGMKQTTIIMVSDDEKTLSECDRFFELHRNGEGISLKQ